MRLSGTLTSVVVAICLTVPMLVGCRGGSAPDGAPATQAATTAPDEDESSRLRDESDTPASDWRRVESSDGTYLVAYELGPDNIPLNEPFGLRVRVYDAGDPSEPLKDIEFSVDARMPHHRHGMNRVPSIARADDGTFHISNMLFHMPGYWELHFDITRGMTTERAQVEVTIE